MKKTGGPSDVQSLAAFAHELREPLGSILLAAQIMSENPCGEESCLDLCQTIERQGRFLARVIEDALEGCHGDQQEPTLRTEWFELGAVLASSVESIRHQVFRFNHHLVVTLPAEPVSVLADAARVQQIVINLLANAAKYTPRGGIITVDMAAVDGWAIIQVRDNGTGIAPENLSRVFEMGCRIKSGQSDGLGGLGVGLALVRSFAEMHGGTVEAQSAGECKGATFSVRLPLQATRTARAGCSGRTSPVARRFGQGFDFDPMSDA